MHLQIGGLDLQIEHCHEVRIEPVMDDSGLDELYRRITISLTCVFNPSATVAGGFPGGGPEAPAYTLAVLQNTLAQPRQRIVVSWGSVILWDVPGFDVASGVILPCDPAGGPFVKNVRVTQVMGLKTFIVQLQVQFHVTQCDDVVLSNRWRATSHTGENFLSRRVIDGRAKLRIDYLNFETPLLMADAFRKNFFLPVPAGFRRDRVDVVATEDGSELLYHCEDIQCHVNLGTTAPASKAWVSATAGIDVPFEGLRGLATASASVAAHGHGVIGEMFSRAAVLGGSLLAGSPLLAGALRVGTFAAGTAGIIPVPKASVTARVEGLAGASIASLAKIGLQLCLDRYSKLTLGKSLFIVSCYVTQINVAGMDETPTIEARMEFLPTSPKVLTALFTPESAIPGLMNWSTNFTGGAAGAPPLPVPMTTDPATGNPAFPASNASRGTWVGFLVTQALKDGCALPDLDAVSATNVESREQPLM